MNQLMWRVRSGGCVEMDDLIIIRCGYRLTMQLVEGWA